MRIRDPKIQHLFKKYISETISKEEMDEMLHYFRQHGIPKEIDQILIDEIQKVNADEIDSSLESTVKGVSDRVEAQLLENLKTQAQTPGYQKGLRHWIPRVAAAVLLCFLAGMIWIKLDQSSSIDKQDPLSSALTVEIAPAGNRASLVLSDGRVINLDEEQQGIVIDGQRITYQDGASTLLSLDEQSPIESITLSTPKGGTYRVTLPDGTEVWLNAASTLKYPSMFRPEERVVHLEGEAYFSVKQIKSANGLLPFKVISANQTIEVLGTEFNVSAYQDETETRTTLVEGKVSVRINEQQENLILLPGEQSLLVQNKMQKLKVDIRDYTDWKNGEFVFRNESTPQVLQRIARWYDVELDYNGRETFNEQFSGSISRYGDLKTVLDIMAEAGRLKFDVNGRTVSVYKMNKKQNIE